MALGLLTGKRDDMVIVGWLADVASPDRRESMRADGCGGLCEFTSDSIIGSVMSSLRLGGRS